MNACGVWGINIFRLMCTDLSINICRLELIAPISEATALILELIKILNKFFRTSVGTVSARPIRQTRTGICYTYTCNKQQRGVNGYFLN